MSGTFLRSNRKGTLKRTFSGYHFHGFKPIWVDVMPGKDMSFGLHICWKGRVDLHIFNLIISVGLVPVYSSLYKISGNQDEFGKKFASSNSFHNSYKAKKAYSSFRAGVPFG